MIHTLHAQRTTLRCSRSTPLCESSLHACTPARLRCLLGDVPAGKLPNTRYALTLHALAPISSLLAGGISWLQAHSSKIIDLTSPNAKRLTARRSLLARTHNRSESFPLVALLGQCSQPASLAALEAINENAPCKSWLIDCLTRTENRATVLLEALKSILYSLLALTDATIHNYKLYMISRLSCASAGVARTDVLGLKIRKTCNVFSVFNRIKTGTYLDELVKRGYDLDKLIQICYVAPTSKQPASFLAGRCTMLAISGPGAELLTGTRLDTFTLPLLLVSLPLLRRPASKPGVFKYMVFLVSWLLSLCDVLSDMVNATEQVTRGVLVALQQLLSSPLASQALSRTFFDGHFVTGESEVRHG